jgi:hypothetical protein
MSELDNAKQSLQQLFFGLGLNQRFSVLILLNQIQFALNHSQP